MKITLDTKSLLFGLAIASVGFFMMSSKSQSDQQNGKFRSEIENNQVVILNTENGDYIIAPDMRDIGKVQWIKGQFYNTFQTAKDNKKQ